MNTVISNAKHPEYGQVTIAFPIPQGQYESVLGLLDTLKIGDVLEQDCQIDEISSYYPILKRMEGSSVNIDELDYLAKRLDSFCEGEDAQFQGMAAKLGLADIRDFINLTFCCQEATVIADFSDLERVGKDHAMTLNGGCMAMDELEKVDGRTVALDLIRSGDGHVTPYGVVYDNGMKLMQAYDGRHFPGYYYEAPVLALEAVSDGNGFTGLISLPMSECQLTRMMQRAETQRYDVHLTASANELPEKASDALDMERMCCDDLYGLNRLCKAVEFFNDYGKAKLNAAVMLTGASDIEALCQLAENLDQFDFVPNVHTPEEYGRYMIRESGHFEYDENLDGFYDYAGYGAQRMKEQGGQFNEYGYVAYLGEMALEELMREDPAEQYQAKQEMQMGGM